MSVRRFGSDWLWLAVGLAAALGALPGAAQEMLPLGHAVVFNNNGRRPPSESVYPLFRLSERFALVEDFYTPANLDATLVENLEQARLLYVGQYSDESPLFVDPELQAAIRAFLGRGGLLFFDYGTGLEGHKRFRPETEVFLKSVGASPPGDFHPGYGTSRFAAADAHTILAGPALIAGKTAGHYGWWQQPAAGQIVLACDRNDPGRATLVLHPGVQRKGTILFNQLPSVCREPRGTCFDLVRNVLAFAYGAGRQSP